MLSTGESTDTSRVIAAGAVLVITGTKVFANALYRCIPKDWNAQEI